MAPPGAPRPTAARAAARAEVRGPRAPRAIGRVAAGLALLALCAASAAALEDDSPGSLNRDLALRERQRQVMRELLGDDRWRRLGGARFEIDLHDRAFTPGLSENPAKLESVEQILLQSLIKLSQKSVERRLRLIERRDALRERLRGGGRKDPAGRSLDVSPRLRLGAQPWLGLKLRLTGVESGFWSRTSLRLGSELDGRDPSVKLEFRDRARRAFLAYHLDDQERGEAIELQIGLSF